MSLVGGGRGDHPVVRRAIEFLINSARPDGSWPIDTNLATWVTTLCVNALATAPEFHELVAVDDRRQICGWLLAQQYRSEHPYTHASPGGWAWTDLPGGVPDADDTAGALLALWNLGFRDPQVLSAACAGITWLLDLQNSDGGIPTFCRGWGNLPFDRSGPDLTGHAILAFTHWLPALRPALGARVRRSICRAVDYLKKSQRPGGEWTPLWFGNQAAPGDENPTYGTARVLPALMAARDFAPSAARPLQRGGRWLLDAQNKDGGWGGAAGVASSIEETSLAMHALAGIAHPNASSRTDLSLDALQLAESLSRGIAWLVARTEGGSRLKCSPIGLYFANLWYAERTYPLIFATAALSSTGG